MLDGSPRVWMDVLLLPVVIRAVHAHSTLFFLPFFPQDNSAPVTIRTKKFTTNRLLSRRQFIVDVIHPSRPPVSRTDVSEKLAVLYKVDKTRVVCFGFKTHFGGGRSTGFALIYDSEESQKKFEPRYRLVRVSVTSSALCCPALPGAFRSSIRFPLPRRLAFRPRWRKLLVSYAKSARIARRK